MPSRPTRLDLERPDSPYSGESSSPSLHRSHPLSVEGGGAVAEGRFDSRLRILVKATAASVGDAFFRDLVETLARVFEVRWAMVGERVGDDIRAIAAWSTDAFLDRLEYPLAGSPCAEVIDRRQLCLHPEAVAEQFPDDSLLAELGVESYAGFPLIDQEGRALGLLVLMDDRPLVLGRRDQDLLGLFGARVTAEVARRQTEQENRRLEAQVLYGQKLESLGVLAGGVAHDFNNHLAVILGNLGLARISLPEDAPIRKYLREAEEAVGRSAELTQQMLAYSGKGRTVVETLDLCEMLSDMAELMRSSVSKKAQVSLALKPGLPEVEGDVSQLRQLAMNLVVNASEAIGSGGGTIHVRTDQVWANAAVFADAFHAEPLDDGNYVLMEVSDDGCGMEDGTRERLFDPFFSTKQTGRGLGMATVLGVVRGHRGAIRVESSPGSGTRCQVFLPPASLIPAIAAPAPGATGSAFFAPPEPESAETAEAPGPDPPSPAEEADSPSPWRGDGRILLVDDEASVRRVARSLLERKGFEVDEARHGRAALELFRASTDRPYRGVILDLNMPELDGIETLERLERLDPEVKVLLTSGYTERQVDLPTGGRVAFLCKPYGSASLGNALRALLEETDFG